MSTKTEALKAQVDSSVKSGDHHVSHSLGYLDMPEGYALMRVHDNTHYYWLHYDGTESAIFASKWDAYNGAKVYEEGLTLNGPSAKKVVQRWTDSEGRPHISECTSDPRGVFHPMSREEDI